MGETDSRLTRVLRILVVTEATLLVIGVAAYYLMVRLLPEPLRRYEEQTWQSELTAADLLLTPLLLAAFVVHVVGWIQIWRRAQTARLFYTTSWALLLLLTTLLGPVVLTGFGSALEDLGTLTGGVILGILYFGGDPRT